jgi:aerobic C4-dicarboxylate transport protein
MTAIPTPRPTQSRVRNALSLLYVQVLIGLVLGVLVGHFVPDIGAELKPLGDAFVALVKMLVGPIVFCTVVLGICSAENMRGIGRIGLKALIYFEVVSTLALLAGLVVGEVVQPGRGMGVDPAELDGSAVEKYTQAPIEGGFVGQLLHIIPTSPIAAFAEGDILQILFFSLLFGGALFALDERGRPVVALIDQFAQVFFRILNAIMRTAPAGAFGAIAFTVGTYGVDTLQQLGLLMVAFYVTCILFVGVVLGTIAQWCGTPLWRLIRYFKQEFLVTLGTTSTEAVLPQCLSKLQFLGCGRSTTSMTFPAGYSFNLDGASIYLTLTVLFIAQATGIDLSAGELLTILAVAFVTSKGGAGVPGAVIFVLAATLQSVGTLPVAGIALILGIDRFMNEIRAVTNLIGNIVATVFVSKSEKQLDLDRARAVLAGEHGTGDDLLEAISREERARTEAAADTDSSPASVPPHG